MSQLELKKAIALVVVFSLAMVVGAAPSSADLQDDIDKANAEAPPVDPDEMSQIDVATADLSQITEQLKALNKQVALSAAAKKKLEAEKKQLGDESTDFESDIEDIQDEIDTLEVELSGRAIKSFKNQNDNSVIVIQTEPSKEIKKRKLSSSVSKNEVETAEELRQKKADLAATEAAKEDVKKKLDEDAEENKKSLAKFENARTALVGVAEEAEQRADRTLSEAEGLGESNKAQADALRKSVEELNEQLKIALKDKVERLKAEVAANPAAFEAKTIEGQVTDADIELAGNGISVHRDIVDQIKAMLAAAEADGITLRGGGYRSSASQIAIRRNNCGTSTYAIYSMPSSSCRPPTARPGSSQHEKGLAIDFTDGNGATIRRGSPGYVWLTNNAAAFGLKNFPVESWHWSTTGR